MSILNELNKYLKEKYNYISSDELSDYDDVDPEDIDDLASKSGINILSDKEINTIVLDDNKIIAGLWVGSDNEEMSFDIVVDPEYQRQGIAKQLIDYAIGEYDMNQEAYGDDYKLKGDIVNPNMVGYLKSKGFMVDDEIQGHILMTYDG